MWRAEETYRESKQGEVENKDSIGTALLSAGTALLMAACLKRAVVLFLVEQWRIWVFLVLNLILVAIFFTSSPSSYSSESQRQEASGKIKQKKIENRECKEGEKVEKVEIKQQEMDKEEEIEEEKEIDEEQEDEEEIGLSKEELNERVEAFIVMFKKQLISDARKGGNRRTPLKSYKSR